MKDKILGAFGAFGYVIVFLLSIVYIAIPLVSTGLPWFVCMIIFTIIVLTDVIGSLVTVAVYVYSFFIVIQSPITVFTILYFVCFIIWLVMQAVPTCIRLLGHRK